MGAKAGQQDGDGTKIRIQGPLLDPTLLGWNEFRGWLRLIWLNHFAMSPSRIAMAAIICTIACFNAGLWFIQFLLPRPKNRADRDQGRSDFRHRPLCSRAQRCCTNCSCSILGNTFPDTYACFSPNHFLVSGWWTKPLLKFLLPAQWPMDNMLAGGTIRRNTSLPCATWACRRPT